MREHPVPFRQALVCQQPLWESQLGRCGLGQAEAAAAELLGVERARHRDLGRVGAAGRHTPGDLPTASKAPTATPAKQAKALHVDAATGATVLTPKAPAKRAPKAKVATTTGDAAVA